MWRGSNQILRIVVLGMTFFTHGTSLFGKAGELAQRRVASDSVLSTCRIKLKDLWLLMGPKIGVTAFTSPKFDIKIIGKLTRSSKYEPLILREETIKVVSDLLDRFSKLGFKQQVFLKILIEAQPNMSAYFRKKRSSWMLRTDSADDWFSPWVGGDDLHYAGVPGLFGGTHHFQGRILSEGFSQSPRFLFLPVIDSSTHVLENEAMVAHELAHATQIESSHNSELWQEARADILAYLVTGKTQFSFPRPHKITTMNSDGIWFLKDFEVIRDLKEPRIKTVADILPSIVEKHWNSQIFSNFLYEFSIHTSDQDLVDFIHFMDFHPPEVLPRLVDRVRTNHQTDTSELTITETTEEGRNITQEQLFKMVKMFRTWADKREFSKDQNDWIQEALKKRGF
ncbi:MAG: hypothetical protein JWQ35_1038 [Bacteriovoracaceae bacterium]|nr:hypothetical protein [Bacteriovoracaceae bacterium]